MYSDMSICTRAFSSPNMNRASCLASSVLPTPVGPAKMKLPMGRFGSFRPGRRAKEEAADGPFRVLQAGPALAHGAGDGGDRLVLADDVLVQLVLHPQQ